MPKGDDHIHKKRGKAIRKRMRRAGSDSLEAIQGVQAARRRRKSGTRRNCEGMCYTLPTPDDPFNDRNDRRRKRKENRALSARRQVPAGEILEFETDVMDTVNGSDFDASAGNEKSLKRKRVAESNGREKGESSSRRNNSKGGKHDTVEERPKKSLKVENSKREVGSRASPFNEKLDGLQGSVVDEVLLAEILSNKFAHGKSRTEDFSQERAGSSFAWKCCEAVSRGGDVLGTSLDWVDRAMGCALSAAAHIKLRCIKHAVAPPLPKPLVLITVASRDQALQVRRILRTLKKNSAISSVSIHSGTSVEDQVNGLSSWTPDVVVGTPERVVALAGLGALSLSSVSLLVVTSLDDNISPDIQIKLQEYLNEGVQKVLIGDKFSADAVGVIRRLMVGQVTRVESGPGVDERSACITQEVSVFTSRTVSNRLPKMLTILQAFREKRGKDTAERVLVLADNGETVNALLPSIQEIGYAPAGLTELHHSQLESSAEERREGAVQALVTTEEFLDKVVLDDIQLVICYSFPSSLKVYQQILTGVARHSVHGKVHSLCTPAMAPLARDFAETLRSCSQKVPQGLQMYADAASHVQNGTMR